MLLIKKEDKKKRQKKVKCTIISSASVGILLLLIPLLAIILDPIGMAIRYGTAVKNGTFLYNIFQSEISGTRMSLFVFNITNSERFITGVDPKLKMEEVGPFTYVETRRNGDIEMNEEDEDLWFTPYMTVRFLPEESIGNPEEMRVTVPNLAYMSATSLLRNYPYLIRSGFNILARQLRSTIITNLDANSFLWGYPDPLIGLANRVAPGLIYFDRLGIIDRLYDNNTLYRMKMSVKHEDKFSVKLLKRYLRSKPFALQVPLESYNFTNTYEGASFPPGLTRQTPLNVYRIGVCRVLNLEFHEEMQMDYGPMAWAYKISNETFNRDCGFGVCGMLDLSNCTFGIPIALSRTHFLNSDPRLYEKIDGMRPDPKKHDSTFVVDPKMGLELATQLSLQLNMVLGDISFSSSGNRFSNMTVPIAYIQVVQPEVFDNFKALLKMAYVYAPVILLCTEIILFLTGAVFLIRAAKLYWDSRLSTEEYIVTSNEKQVPLMS